MPAKIIATQYMSLDGVIEDPVGMESSGLGDWTGPFSRGPEGDKFKQEELLNCEAMIFGRKTYEGFAAVWPTVHDESGFADRMNTLPKYLASTTMTEATWNNTTILAGDLANAARSLRDAMSGNILIFGSGSVVHTLMSHGLIDEFRLMVYPTVLGRGVRLFPENVAAMLKLIECKQLNDGILLLRYVHPLASSRDKQ